jgi:hypothetical protein
MDIPFTTLGYNQLIFNHTKLTSVSPRLGHLTRPFLFQVTGCGLMTIPNFTIDGMITIPKWVVYDSLFFPD